MTTSIDISEPTQEQLEKFKQDFPDFEVLLHEFVDAVVEAVRPIIVAVLNVIRRFHEIITRWLLAKKLMRCGLPIWLSHRLAMLWPRRWLPTRWVWMLNMGPPG